MELKKSENINWGTNQQVDRQTDKQKLENDDLMISANSIVLKWKIAITCESLTQYTLFTLTWPVFYGK